MSTAVDEGVSNERTALAWQRTALALAASAAFMARLTWTTLGAGTLIPLSVAALLSLWVFCESHARYSDHARPPRRASPRVGRRPLALTGATTLLALTEITALTRA